jgi:HAD superfamily hydrolase (TIGR01490 family)
MHCAVRSTQRWWGVGTTERQLALFDLDFTLIPFDSGMHWLRFLTANGVLEPGYDDAYLALCLRYVAGQGDAKSLHRVVLGSLARLSPDGLPAWQRRFAATLEGALPAGALDLVARHQAQGDLCCIVTATTRAIAAPFAQGFGVEHLIASEAEQDEGQRRFTGEIRGELCHGAAKLRRVRDWLESRDEDWGDFSRITFYSDSGSDVPLLAAVSDAVAVRPDDTLRRYAETHGWRILEDFSQDAADFLG